MKIETDSFHFSAAVANDKRLPPPAKGENEFAAFAAQFAHRADRLRQSRMSEPSHPVVEAVIAVETRRPAEMWAGGLLLGGLAVAALFVWGWPTEPVTGSLTGNGDAAAIDSPAPPADTRQAVAQVALSPVTAPAPAPQPSPATSPPPAATATPTPADPSPATAAPSAAAPSVAPAPPSVAELIATTRQPPAPPVATSAKGPDPGPLSSDEVRELQCRLRVAGFDPGPIDGIVGPLTTAAARRFGEARKLATTDPARGVLVRLRSEPSQSAQLPTR